MPPAVAVNHETRECAEIFTGDECMVCAPAAGWEIVGVAGDVPYPSDPVPSLGPRGPQDQGRDQGGSREDSQGPPSGQCPEGYAMLDALDVTCTPFQNDFCCSEGHSGAPGDCTNLVVHERNEECAFPGTDRPTGPGGTLGVRDRAGVSPARRPAP